MSLPSDSNDETAPLGTLTLNQQTSDDTPSPEDEDELDSGYFPEYDDTPLPVPAVDRRLVTQPIDLTIRTIVQQIDDKSLTVQPTYQRRYVWDDRHASRLIESLLMNVPIPGCFFAEEENGGYTVIDGQQRLYASWRFVRNNMKLKGLRTLPEYNGKVFQKLTEREQRIILGRTIRCTVITQESHPEIRFEVFERLNTSSVPLTDQEIRNAIYRGKFNYFLKSLADEPVWLKLLAKKQLDKRMRDDELLLRFFAVQDNYVGYLPPLRSFLNTYAAQKKLSFADTEEVLLKELFEQTVEKALAIFDGHAFRLFNATTNEWETPLNRALFDAVMLVFSKIPIEDLKAKKVEIEGMLKTLCADDKFLVAVSRSTADRTSFDTRISMFSKAMNQIGLKSNIHQTLRS